GARSERVERALLERVVMLVGKPESLANVTDRYRDRRGPRRARAARLALLADGGAHRPDGSNGTAGAATDKPVNVDGRGTGLVLASAAVNVCTIIAKNYLAYARVLAKSLREHHPASRLWTLIVDDFD